MTGRISLLILMTGLFAAAWSSDHPPAKTMAAAEPDQQYRSEAVRETTLHRWPITRNDRMVDVTDNWAPVTAIDQPAAAQKVSGTLKSSHSIPLIPVLAHLLARNWIEAGQQLHSSYQAQQHSMGQTSNPAIPLSEQITSQPGSRRSSQR